MTWKVPVKYTITVVETVIVEAENMNIAANEAVYSILSRQRDTGVKVENCFCTGCPQNCKEEQQ